jgi:hypothetical protein
MQAKIMAWLLSFAGAIGKRLITEATPTLIGLSRELGGAIFDLGYDELDPDLTAEDKKDVQEFALNVGRTAWAVAKAKGVLLASDVPGLIAQAVESDLASALGL